MIYTFKMSETRMYSVEYTVDATDEEEAQEKALKGDTVSEDNAALLEITDRGVCDSGTVQCHCLIKHANTSAEREYAEERLKYAHKINDTHDIRIAELMLDNSRCPARPR